nr:MAG TPA: Head Tail Connector Protein [Caudoviricetes sp.]
MTAIISLTEAKAWLRVDTDDEDALITSLINAATGLVEARLRRPVIGDTETGAVCEDLEGVPAPIRMAALAVVALMYERRDATADDVNARVLTSAWLDPYIDWES